MRHEISIRSLDAPRSENIRDEIRWVFDSLGLISGRDTADTSFQIFYEFLKGLSPEDCVSVSSQEIADKLNIETSKVNHHIRTLTSCGILFREKKKIRLRGGSLSAAIEEMRKDADRIFDDLIEISEEIDKALKFR